MLVSELEDVDADADADVDVDEGVDVTNDAVEARDAERGAMTSNALVPTTTTPVSTTRTRFHTTPRNVSIPTATTPCGPTKATNRCLQQSGKNVNDKALDRLHEHMVRSQ